MFWTIAGGMEINFCVSGLDSFETTCPKMERRRTIFARTQDEEWNCTNMFCKVKHGGRGRGVRWKLGGWAFELERECVEVWNHREGGGLMWVSCRFPLGSTLRQVILAVMEWDHVFAKRMPCTPSYIPLTNPVGFRPRVDSQDLSVSVTDDSKL